jgi:hypothetical protein
MATDSVLNVFPKLTIKNMATVRIFDIIFVITRSVQNEKLKRRNMRKHIPLRIAIFQSCFPCERQDGYDLCFFSFILLICIVLKQNL